MYKKEKPDIVHHVGMKVMLFGTIAARFAGVKNVVNAISGTGMLFASRSLSSRVVLSLLKKFSNKKFKW